MAPEEADASVQAVEEFLAGELLLAGRAKPGAGAGAGNGTAHAKEWSPREGPGQAPPRASVLHRKRPRAPAVPAAWYREPRSGLLGSCSETRCRWRALILAWRREELDAADESPGERGPELYSQVESEVSSPALSPPLPLLL